MRSLTWGCDLAGSCDVRPQVGRYGWFRY
ncbi:hypothetical protein RSAG8_13692, partial [Rhizoctonia solani AG-8 WAC10335]